MEDEWSADSSRNVTAHGDARLGKWRGNWRMEWVASTLHTTSEHGASSITTADAHTSAASSRLNWQPCWFKWTRPFRRKTKSGFCACAIAFQLVSTTPKSLYSGGETLSLPIKYKAVGHRTAGQDNPEGRRISFRRLESKDDSSVVHPTALTVNRMSCHRSYKTLLVPSTLIPFLPNTKTELL